MRSSELPRLPSSAGQQESSDPPEKIGPGQGTKVHRSSPEQDWVPLLEGLRFEPLNMLVRVGSFANSDANITKDPLHT